MEGIGIIAVILLLIIIIGLLKNWRGTYKMRTINTILDIITIIFFGIIIIVPFVLPNALTSVSNALGWGLAMIYYIDKHMITHNKGALRWI